MYMLSRQAQPNSGEHWQLGIKELLCKAAQDAMKSANLTNKDIDALFVANCFSRPD